MKILIIVFIMLVTSSIFAQYEMNIKKADNTTEIIWVHDIVNVTFTNIAFTCGTSTIIYAGQTYNTVQIGSQCWLKENLNVGTRINGSSDQTNNNIIEKYCYNDDENNCNTYGGLYEWAEAVQYQNGATNTTSPSPALTVNVQGICPTGWHISTYTEMQTLATAAGNNSNTLKAVGQGTGSGSGTNSSGFSALLAGDRNGSGTFYYLNYDAYYWSSTEGNSGSAYDMHLYYDGSSIYFGTYNKTYGFSVRCCKD